MFASTGFVLEYDYATLKGLWGAGGMLAGWLELFGVICAFALGVWFLVCCVNWLTGRKALDMPVGVPLPGVPKASLQNTSFYGLTGRLANVPPEEVWKPRSFWLLCGLAAAACAAAGVVLLVRGKAPMSMLWIGCASAILAVCWEFLLDIGKFSWRRIWALARFSIKEAIRRRALWSFCVILAVF